MDLIFDTLKEVFINNNFNLYMIGSSSRDYLLNREIKDYDFVTDALPSEVTKFLECDTHFIRFGVLKTKVLGKEATIVTLREEQDYIDNRHPSKVSFVKDIYLDYKRRDFTINALYIDKDYNVIDPTDKGLEDLKNKRLRFIKDPLVSIEEDPLRILRFFRFKEEYDLTVDEETLKIVNSNLDLLNRLNPSKIKEEQKKMEKIK